jgi:antitoxin FitA
MDVIAISRGNVAVVKQLIARIDDQLHRKLKERAEIEGRSLNAVVVDALQATVVTNERAMVRSRLRDAGLLLEPAPAPVAPLDEDAIIESTHGVGRAVSDALQADRDSRW